MVLTWNKLESIIFIQLVWSRDGVSLKMPKSREGRVASERAYSFFARRNIALIIPMDIKLGTWRSGGD